MSKIKFLNSKSALFHKIKSAALNQDLYVVVSSVGEMVMTLEGWTALRYYLDECDRQSMQVLPIASDIVSVHYSWVWTAEDVERCFGHKPPAPPA